MAEITLDPLCEADAPALFAFEVENRHWFEAWVGPRPDTYWEQTSLARIIRAQVEEGEAMFLIKRQQEILGRLNLTAAQGGVAQLGYRVGQRHTGQGAGSAAVRLGIDAARDLGLWALEARVIEENLASQRVLEKNGFVQTGTSEIDGLRCVWFRRDLD